jgi:GNAT superfamily N-acetyltransferase
LSERPEIQKLGISLNWPKGGAMTNQKLTHRLASRDDLETLKALMDAAISELQKPFLYENQITSSRAIMGLDTQLIDDGTYFIVESDGQLAGCGGWSRRATMYGGDQTPGRSAALLDPMKDAARIRAMYTHPNHTRKGVGRLIISLCEEAARAEGFTTMELVATLSGEPLYRACGFVPYENIVDDRGGAGVPLLRMKKSL